MVMAVGFCSNVILCKTMKNNVLEVAACGGIKKMQCELLSGLQKHPKARASSVQNPGAILTFLPETGYFFSNVFPSYCSVFL